MFARSVTIRVKPNATAELNKTIEKDILPVLKKQKGFQDELTLVAPTDQKSLVSACGIKDKMPSLSTHNLSRGAEALVEID